MEKFATRQQNMRRKVLFIKAGGTIGMQPTRHGYDAATAAGVDPTYEYLQEIDGLKKIADIDSIALFDMDSTDIGLVERRQIAECIFTHYDRYAGFVVAHGTDTMLDSAAAVQCMLAGLGKPVVFTGAQIPLFGRVDSDGRRNVYNAISLACKDIGEVVISFGSRILRADQAIKFSEEDMDAFHSYKSPPIGENGLEVRLTGAYRRRHDGTALQLFTDFDDNIAVYTQISGGRNSLSAYAGAAGVIIQGFGAGNINKDLIAGIRQLVDNNIPVVVTTYCVKGAAEMDIYAVGNRALAAGAFSAQNMTLPATQQKLMCLLGRFRQSGLPLTERVDYVRRAFAELTK